VQPNQFQPVNEAMLPNQPPPVTTTDVLNSAPAIARALEPILDNQGRVRKDHHGLGQRSVVKNAAKWLFMTLLNLAGSLFVLFVAFILYTIVYPSRR